MLSLVFYLGHLKRFPAVCENKICSPLYNTQHSLCIPDNNRYRLFKSVSIKRILRNKPFSNIINHKTPYTAISLHTGYSTKKYRAFGYYSLLRSTTWFSRHLGLSWRFSGPWNPFLCRGCVLSSLCLFLRMQYKSFWPLKGIKCNINNNLKAYFFAMKWGV